MAVTRFNILTNAAARTNYTKGVNLLKQEFPGNTTTSLGIPGPSKKVSTYDLFVVWHNTAMMTFTPPTQSDRNAAHRGPVFLPWHRFMLRQLELNLQRVLHDNNFGLPYWDWAADGQLTAAQQKLSPLWAATALGGQGSPVSTGPFAYNAANPNSFRVRIDEDPNGSLRQVDRGLRRSFATSGVTTLPKKAQTASALALTPYDAANWDTSSSGFRNRVEGWQPAASAPGLHNRVHVWVGGDMLPSTSPNDPVFFMNHCNVDRIWEAWMHQHGRVYLPPDTAPSSLKGHRLNDQLSSLISPPTTPAAMLNVTNLYTYDSLAV
jgi:tyrosinase